MIDYSWIAVQALCGALGATARWVVMTVVPSGTWSWGLFAVNMAGSAFVGAVVGAFSVGVVNWMVTSVVLAFAAGFTTFSALALAAAEMAERGGLVRGLAFALVHVVAGIVVAGAVYISAEALFGA